MGTARGQQYPQLHKDLSTSHRDRPSTVTGFVVEAKTYLRVNDLGLHNTNCTSPQQPRIRSRGWSTCYDASIRFTLIRSVGQYNIAELCWLDRRVCRVRFYNTLSKSRDQGRVAGLLGLVSYELTCVTVEVHHPLKLITPRQSPAYTRGGLESLNFLL